MTHSEMLDAVRKVFFVHGTDEEIDHLVLELDALVPNANISDMIFYPDVKRDPEQIVAEALRREEQHAAHLTLIQRATA